jgi:DNA-binding MarR family transcriptional regulator
VTESTISIQVTKLEDGGYVRRIPDGHDQRRVRVRLTAKGMQVKQQNTVLDPDLVAEMISLLRSEQAEAALHGLEILAAAAEKLMSKRRIRRSRRAR